MDKKWLLGFIEGSACFSIVIRKSNNKIGYQTVVDFTLKLPAKNKALLEEIQSFLGVGRIYENKGEVILKSTRLDDSERLVKIFRGNFFTESKKNEFSVWKKCVSIMAKSQHHTPAGILEIARLRDSIHSSPWNKKNFCSIRIEIDPCEPYVKTKEIPTGCNECLVIKFPKEAIK